MEYLRKELRRGTRRDCRDVGSRRSEGKADWRRVVMVLCHVSVNDFIQWSVGWRTVRVFLIKSCAALRSCTCVSERERVCVCLRSTIHINCLSRCCREYKCWARCIRLAGHTLRHKFRDCRPSGWRAVRGLVLHPRAFLHAHALAAACGRLFVCSF